MLLLSTHIVKAESKLSKTDYLPGGCTISTNVLLWCKMFFCELRNIFKSRTNKNLWGCLCRWYFEQREHLDNVNTHMYNTFDVQLCNVHVQSRCTIYTINVQSAAKAPSTVSATYLSENSTSLIAFFGWSWWLLLMRCCSPDFELWNQWRNEQVRIRDNKFVH